MSDSPLQYNKQPVSPDTFLKAKEMDHESGSLGKFFGSARSAPLNIAGLLALILVGAAIGFTIFPPKDVPPMDFWKVVMPVLTLILGYAFGKKT